MYKLTFKKRVWIVKQYKKGVLPAEIALDVLGIKHYLSRIKRPQTNGKVERFFLTYKTEYATGTFSNIQDYIRHYNENRLHMSLQYRTPKEVWCRLSV